MLVVNRVHVAISYHNPLVPQLHYASHRTVNFTHRLYYDIGNAPPRQPVEEANPLVPNHLRFFSVPRRTPSSTASMIVLFSPSTVRSRGLEGSMRSVTSEKK